MWEFHWIIRWSHPSRRLRSSITGKNFFSKSHLGEMKWTPTYLWVGEREEHTNLIRNFAEENKSRFCYPFKMYPSELKKSLKTWQGETKPRNFATKHAETVWRGSWIVNQTRERINFFSKWFTMEFNFWSDPDKLLTFAALCCWWCCCQVSARQSQFYGSFV